MLVVQHQALEAAESYPTPGPLIVLGEGRSEFAEICCGVSGRKFVDFDLSRPEK